LLDRYEAGRTLVLGQVLLACGLLLLLRVPRDASYWSDLAPAYAFIGFGLGFSQVAVQGAAFAGVPTEEAGLAGGLVETSGEFGGAFAVARWCHARGRSAAAGWGHPNSLFLVCSPWARLEPSQIEPNGSSCREIV
jgi:MFS family permease